MRLDIAVHDTLRVTVVQRLHSGSHSKSADCQRRTYVSSNLLQGLLPHASGHELLILLEQDAPFILVRTLT